MSNKPSFVVYRRISSSKQEKSGLGLEAQLNEINSYLSNCDSYTISGDFVEVESGKDHNNRPILKEAIDLATSTHSTILVSRLCRLSRDMEFICGLMKNTKVDFKIATNPHADNFTIAIHAALVFKERELISIRTKAALKAAKERGIKLGTTGRKNLKKLNEVKTLKAYSFASQLKPLVVPLRESGKTYQEISNILNQMGMKTPQGKNFQPASVHRYEARF